LGTISNPSPVSVRITATGMKQVSRAESSCDLLVANLAHRRVVDPSADRTVGTEDPLSVGGVYARRRVARRIAGPAIARREVAWPRLAETRDSPISGTVPSSMIATSGGIRW
jgi:hypothetical protein